MYRGFDVNLSDGLSFQLDSYNTEADRIGETLHASLKKRIQSKLKVFLQPGGEIDAAAMQDHWFPQIKSHVFISHSHDDLGLAKRLSGWLSDRLGVECFIDACAWGNIDELLWDIDKEYCWNSEKETFSYDRRNLSTSHVHMMLSMALMKMIDRTECIFFLNTPSSIKPGEVIKGCHGVTKSPWIYSELASTRLIEKRSPDEHRPKLAIAKSMDEAERFDKSFAMLHTVNLDHLTSLTVNNLAEWANCDQKGNAALDWLYQKHPAPKRYSKT